MLSSTIPSPIRYIVSLSWGCIRVGDLAEAYTQKEASIQPTLSTPPSKKAEKIIKMNDVYTKANASGKCDQLGSISANQTTKL